MSEYYVTITFTDNTSIRVLFDSLKELNCYIININQRINCLNKNEIFINVGNKDFYFVPVQTIKSIIFRGSAV